MKHKPSEERLRAEMAASHALGQSLDNPDFPLDQLLALQAFQRARLATTYADLKAQDRYRPAVEFFLQELYGGLHFRKRDEQVMQVLPIMTRMLPDYMLNALADAFRLQTMSLELDIQLTHFLCAQQYERLDEELYAQAYASVPRAQREAQISLICKLGNEISELVRHRIVLLLIRAMRGPAHAAGFGVLQQFLEGGLAAFRTMGDSTEFIETIRNRETEVMQRIYAGKDKPFRLKNSS